MKEITEETSKQAALAFMNDPAYIPHLKAQTAVFDSHHFLIGGKGDVT